MTVLFSLTMVTIQLPTCLYSYTRTCVLSSLGESFSTPPFSCNDTEIMSAPLKYFCLCITHSKLHTLSTVTSALIYRALFFIFFLLSLNYITKYVRKANVLQLQFFLHSRVKINKLNNFSTKNF